MPRLKVVLPILLISLLAACSKEEPSTPPAAAPSAESTPAPAPAPAPESTPAPAPQAAAPEAAAPAAGAAPAGDNAAAGEKVYKTTCSLCHSAGVGGAPKFGSLAEWGPRIQKGKDVLYQHALNGFTGEKGMMPPKGGNTSLSDDDVKAAVDYMASQAK